jgi:hypothetical protein
MAASDADEVARKGRVARLKGLTIQKPAGMECEIRERLNDGQAMTWESNAGRPRSAGF